MRMRDRSSRLDWGCRRLGDDLLSADAGTAEVGGPYRSPIILPFIILPFISGKIMEGKIMGSFLELVQLDVAEAEIDPRDGEDASGSRLALPESGGETAP